MLLGLGRRLFAILIAPLTLAGYGRRGGADGCIQQPRTTAITPSLQKVWRHFIDFAKGKDRFTRHGPSEHLVVPFLRGSLSGRAVLECARIKPFRRHRMRQIGKWKLFATYDGSFRGTSFRKPSEQECGG